MLLNKLNFFQGQLVEEGTYEKLINAKGKFEALAKNQIQKEQEDKKDAQADFNELDVIPDVQPKDKKNSQIHPKKESQNSNTDQKVQSANKDPAEKVSLTKEEQRKLDEEDKGMLRRLHEINKPEQMYFYIGTIFALANGLIFPLSGLLLGEFVDVLSKPSSPSFRSDANMLSLYFVFLAIGAQVFTVFQQYLFTKVGEGLTLRVRQDVFRKMMKMPGGWFDKVENNPGTLSARLAVDAHQVNGLTSNIISIQIQNISSLLTGLIIAFVHSWSMSLVALGVCPLMIIAGQLQAKFVQGFSENTDSAYKDSGLLIMESVTNIRTVASFSNEKKIEQFYAEKLLQPYNIAFKKGNYSGAAFGFSQFAMFGVYAIIFICGALFVREYGLSIKNMFVTIFAILFAAFGAGNSNQFMGDVGAAKTACRNLFKILDSEDELQMSEKRVANQVKEQIFGDIEFRNVSFKYPTRDAQVFENLSFTIKAGQKVAFVGPSGSGKSSVLQLLLRFYDNYEGQIIVDGKDIRNYDIREFRRSFGVVSQEPVLFNGTISQNIKYNSQGVTFETIKEAARQANAIGFIEKNEFDTIDQKDGKTKNLGKGFNRKVGTKGSQISGGQKQRIAIARAVIKNPNVLLLDEATSALDDENEKIVQEALNQLMKGKTSLCVAHRISTIKDSDQIFVIEAGKLVEQGTYESLMARKQFFYRLNAH